MQAPGIEQATSESESAQKENAKPESANKPEEPATREIPKAALVRGPQLPTPAAAPAAKPAEQKKPTATPEEENKGVFDKMKQDLENVGKVLNPFRW